MTDHFYCIECGLIYQTQNGLRKHLKKYHSSTIISSNTSKKYCCSKCNRPFKIRQTKWAEEKKCWIKPDLTIEEKDFYNKEKTEKITIIKNIKLKISLTNYLKSVIFYNDSEFFLCENEISKAILNNNTIAEYFLLRGKARFFYFNYNYY